MSTENKLIGIGLLLALIYLLHLLSPILSPFVISALLAYLGDPLVDKLEKRFSRTVSVSIVFAFLSVLFISFLIFVVPIIGSQLEKLIAQLPELYQWGQLKFDGLLNRLFPDRSFLSESSLVAFAKENADDLSDVAQRMIGWITGSGGAVVLLISNLFLIPVVTFYLLRDWDKLVEKLRLLIPRYIEPKVTQIAKDANEKLSAFLRGQFMVMNALGIIYATGLSILGVNSGILIGFIAGWISFIPYLGLIVGSTVAVVLAYFQFNDILHPTGVVVVFLVAQVLEGAVLTPKFVGEKIGLHPVAVIFAVLAGGQLAGFMGVLLALPIAAVLNVLIFHAQLAYRQSSLYDKKESKRE